MDPTTLKPRPEVFGHQGAPVLAPENTLWSFQRALQMNVTGLEADVTIREFIRGYKSADDPFWTVNTMSLQEKNLTAKQSVCSLEQLLKLASYHNSTVVFRLRRPPPEHPCYTTWINDTLEAVQDSGVLQNLVGGKHICGLVYVLHYIEKET
ncbi:hypothetical protein XENOCAPTIV_016400 [Xenoophorus captivus]|uniref:GP-PDE domain-containing protein n=1 Tax=Xenoophorus captivus TaxID=1517983 RepID=A0ABV0R988_9TELE